MALVEGTGLPEGLLPLKELVVCPSCRSDLQFATTSLRCSSCGANFLVTDGIPELAVFGESRNFTVQTDVGETYQHKYTDDEASAGYDTQFVEVPHKKARTDRELRIIQRLLGSTGKIARLLNIPCGGGRLSRPLAAASSTLVEADVSLTQARYARSHGSYPVGHQVGFMTASGFHAPFASGCFDGVVCARLIHHFSETEDHERLIEELCRIASRFVILSFNDSFSVKAISRKLRVKSSPMTLPVAEVERMAGAHGFRLENILAVSHLGSRHRYALLVRAG